MNSRHPLSMSPSAGLAAEARYGLRITALLSEHSNGLSHGVAERLRFARNQAVERAQQARAATAAAGAINLDRGGSLSLSGGGSRWLPWASVLPLLALVLGLLLIQHEHSEAQITEAADVDTALLGDDLPPAAYGDAGFVEFLKTPRN